MHAAIGCFNDGHVILPSALYLGKDLIDHDVFCGGLAECDEVIFPTDANSTHRSAFRFSV
jgi:hypothetical protein